MNKHNTSCPMAAKAVVDAYFLEHRAKLIDLAAFFDRVQRARADGGGGGDDFRVEALRAALAIVVDDQPQRTRRVLELLSDQTTELAQSAAGMKGALGAARREVGSEK